MWNHFAHQCNHHILWLIPLVVIALESVSIQPDKDLFVSDHRISSRIDPVGGLHEKFPQLTARIVFPHFYFLLNDGLFSLHLQRIQGAFTHIGEEEPQGFLPVPGRRRDVIDRAVERGGCIGCAADAFKSLPGFILCKRTGRSSGNDVLQVVGDAGSQVLAFID